MTETGQQAPEFTLPRDGGGETTLSEFRGSPVVLYFYPKDMTPGCTNEAIDFSRLKGAFDKTGAVVIGVSKDSVARHDKFKAKHDLEVILASDESGAMIEDYGFWVEKKLYGRTYMGIERATLLIDRDGTIARIWRKVRVKGHAEDVLAAVQAL